jgi:LmbE family N-acetylglucosaminyl deacetylase
MMKKDRILIISPHPDDETLGMGGTIAKLINSGTEIFILTVSGHLPPLYKQEDYEITIEEARNAYKVLGVSNFDFLEIPATMISDLPVHEINSKISNVVVDFLPDQVFIPFPDRHIDHRVIFDSAMVATRPVKESSKINLVACYETLSETHWNAPYLEPNFTPNFVVDIDDFIEVKLEALRCYQSQITENNGPRSISSVKALSKFRGSQSGFGFGEAFFVTRMTD